MRVIVSVLVALMVVNGPVTVLAGPIIERARALAARTVPGTIISAQQNRCAPELVTRARNDASRVGTGGYLAGGLVLPIIMPLIAGGMSSNPPFTATNGMNPDDARCYSAAYSDDVGQRKVSSAWKGTWIGVGAYVGLAVLVAVTGPSY